jgi:hypothetical protein
MRLGEHVKRMGEKRIACRFLMERSGRKIALGVIRHSWEYNIKMEPKSIIEVVWTGFTWLRIGTRGGFLRRQ